MVTESSVTAIQLLRKGEVAARLGVSERQIELWIVEGRLAVHRFGPKLLRIDENEVRRFVEGAASGRRSRASVRTAGANLATQQQQTMHALLAVLLASGGDVIVPREIISDLARRWATLGWKATVVDDGAAVQFSLISTETPERTDDDGRDHTELQPDLGGADGRGPAGDVGAAGPAA